LDGLEETKGNRRRKEIKGMGEASEGERGERSKELANENLNLEKQMKIKLSIFKTKQKSKLMKTNK
jgi:hypothetical protein